MHEEWATPHIKMTNKGFTIVELLIVVVVIAILAAITIVAFNGIQNRAKESAIQSSASQVGKKIASYYYTNSDMYPSQANFASVTGIASNADTTYDYIVSADSKNYCASAANSNNVVSSYSTTQSSGGTVKGRCMTNMESNPSSETVMINSAGAGGATRSISATQKFSGASSTRFVWVSATSGVQSSIITVAPSTTYSVSLYVFVESGALPAFRVGASDYATNSTDLSGTAAIGSWQRLSLTYTTNSTQTTLRTWGLVSAASTFYIDAIMITPLASGLPVYADGNSANWFWNGTANNSTSFGPSIVQ